uniref:protein-tyrosine-phosphatase n=1 Tax=Crassostrea virginica TaxID=6565 RepID=A0A8B8CKV0_CRAVI|nr:receptor-type tyrosine-protein phosphatase kappa-like isoform X1 [Crassostrea virginica]
MDLLHRLPQIIVISACITSIHNQCLDDSSCTCHCLNCSWYASCTSCAKGWNGTTANYCQRKNVAYKATVASSSTRDPDNLRSYGPENAVDEDTDTVAVTKSGKNPWLSVRLSEYLNVSRISVYLDIDYSETYEVFVTDSSLSSLPINDHLCETFDTTKKERVWKYVKCSNERVLTGNKIILRKKANQGRLIVYEIQIFKCSQGTYGPQCESVCRNCQDNRCNEDTGVCEVGCKSGWYGDKCDRECPSRCASYCDRYRGCTNCLDVGYSGPSCYQCTSNTYGRNCSQTCQNCLDCNHITGCQDCVAGFYGAECTLKCEQGCKTASCERYSGNCVDGCQDGYMGFNCAEPCKGNCATCNTTNLCSSCVSGKFGIQCENDCPESCGGNDRCDKNSGNCLECIPSRFGPHCTDVCSNNCLQPGACLRNGDCTNGCAAGWIGTRCDMQCSVQNCKKCIESSGHVSCEICNDGYFLDNTGGCQNCPSKCVSCKNDSICNQCIPGFKGSLCNEECNTNCIDGLCSIDGSCTYGCNNAKYGIGCGIECEDKCVHCFNRNNCTKCLPGFYGLYCTWKCKNTCYNCTEYDVCENCKAGFYGRSCSNLCHNRCETCESADRCSSCRKGWSGPLCKCSENCSPEACGNDGKCNGCKDSFYGDYCNVICPSRECQKCDQSSGNCTMCSKGFYGSNCEQKCSSTCVETACGMTGECLQGCKENFIGVMCAEKQQIVSASGFPVYIYAVLGIAVLFVLLIIALLIVLKRKLVEKKKLSQNGSNNLRVTEYRNENAVYANENIEHETNFCIENRKRSVHNQDSSLYNLRGSQALLNELDPNEEDDVEMPVQTESEYYNVQITRIPVGKLWEVIEKKRLNGELEKEYESIPNGLLEPCKEALKPQNRSRNRYKKMYPYDSTRVILETEEGTSDSDFINACYVNGFDESKEYIAAQGPFTPETVHDFWRMTWQQNCGKIIMLTNLIENGVVKCQQYWPDTEDFYGSFHVKMEKEEPSANYTIRTFRLTLNGITKFIKQFHFTAWPDKGVPRNVTSIVNFRNKVFNYDVKMKGPQIIHCSAGVGRTGTYMALDYLIQQGERQGGVDVINCVASMRHQRVHVVQTVEQYIFLHDALVDALTEGNRTVTAAEFPEYYSKLKQQSPSSKNTGLWDQFQLINRLSPALDEKCFQTARLVENKCKNRYDNILPSDNYRIFLSSSDTDYINAIQLPGFKNRNTFALTQMPLPNTVLDFWSLVLEQDVSTIVMMNSFIMDKKTGVYWPVDAEEVSFGSIVISLLETSKRNVSFDVLKFKVVNTKQSNEERILKQFQCKFWPEEANVPENPYPMLEMIEEVNKWQCQVNNPTIVVHCMNGAKKSGLFCTVATIIERLRSAHEIGVLQTVVQMRSRRPQILASREQLKFCYEAVQAYLDMTNTYSNLI